VHDPIRSLAPLEVLVSVDFGRALVAKAPSRAEGPTLTDLMMTMMTLLVKGSDADLPGAAIGSNARQLTATTQPMITAGYQRAAIN
jgi:hypothetical protein